MALQLFWGAPCFLGGAGASYPKTSGFAVTPCLSAASPPISAAAGRSTGGQEPGKGLGQGCSQGPQGCSAPSGAGMGRRGAQGASQGDTVAPTHTCTHTGPTDPFPPLGQPQDRGWRRGGGGQAGAPARGSAFGHRAPGVSAGTGSRQTCQGALAARCLRRSSVGTVGLASAHTYAPPPLSPPHTHTPPQAHPPHA